MHIRYRISYKNKRGQHVLLSMILLSYTICCQPLKLWMTWLNKLILTAKC